MIKAYLSFPVSLLHKSQLQHIFQHRVQFSSTLSGTRQGNTHAHVISLFFPQVVIMGCYVYNFKGKEFTPFWNKAVTTKCGTNDAL